MTLVHIHALAEELAAKYNPGKVSPFPFEDVLKDHPDLKIYFTALDDDNVSGTILFENGEFSILINSNKPVTRQNFTLGHELGHYFLHKDRLKRDKGIIDGEEVLDGPKVLYRRDAGNDSAILETQANHFAATLLMPADLVRRAWEATRS